MLPIFFVFTLAVMCLTGPADRQIIVEAPDQFKHLENWSEHGILETVVVADCSAFILKPLKNKSRHPQEWLAYAPTSATYPDGHEKWMFDKFLEAGIAVVGIDMGESYGSMKDQAVFTSFFDDLTKNHGFAKKCCLFGRSRGGLLVGSWAINNPEKVIGIAGIYPVFNLASYPGIKKAAESFGLDDTQMKLSFDQYNPVAQINVLAEAGVKIFLIHGDADKSVALSQNALAVRRKYEQANAGKAITIIVAKGQNHDCWSGYFRNQKLVDFVIQCARQNGKKHK